MTASAPNPTSTSFAQVLHAGGPDHDREAREAKQTNSTGNLMSAFDP
jgi:hypothetical protein